MKGVEKDLYDKLVAASSRSAAGAALGNSICVCVLERMLPSFMEIAGLERSGVDRIQTDVWMGAVQQWQRLGQDNTLANC